MIRAANQKMMIKTEDCGSCHRDGQQEQTQPFLGGPQQSQGKQRAEQNHDNDEEHASRWQGHMEFPVSGAVDNVHE